MRKLTSLSQALIAIASTLEENKILPLVVDRTKELIGAEKVVASLMRKRAEKFRLDSTTLAVRGRRDQHPETWWRTELEDIISSVAGKNRIPVILAEADKWAKDLIRSSRETSLACVPFTTKENGVGVLSALNSYPHHFTTDEIAVLSILASQAAVSLENARIFKELKARSNELGYCIRELRGLAGKLLNFQEEERKRISRELHDDTAQSLTNLILRLEMSEALVPPELTEVRQALKELKELTATALEAVYQMTFNLRPTMLDELGLIPTIRWYIHNNMEKANVSVSFEVIGREVNLSSQTEIAILRIMQEALTNVKKHAQVGKASLCLEFADNEAVVTIKDEGKGFDPNKVFGKHPKREALGLIGMKERAEFLGGTLNVKSQPGKGTTVTARVPVR